MAEVNDRVPRILTLIEQMRELNFSTLVLDYAAHQGRFTLFKKSSTLRVQVSPEDVSEWNDYCAASRRNPRTQGVRCVLRPDKQGRNSVVIELSKKEHVMNLETQGENQSIVDQPVPIQRILEYIEEARLVNFGTVILSRFMGQGDIKTHYNKGMIFRQFLASDLQLWTDYYEANRSAPRLNGVRSDLSETSDGPRVTIRLTPRDSPHAQLDDVSEPTMINLSDPPRGDLDPDQLTDAAWTPAPMNNSADPRAMGLGDPDYCALLPKQRNSHEAQGLVLFLPYTGITVVPYEMGHGGGWYAVVAEDVEHYKRAGHKLWISASQIETGILRPLTPVDRTILEGN